MEPLAVLVVLPIAIGVVSELVFRDTTHASFAAALGTAVVVFVTLRLLAPAGMWNWLATLLVSPLPIAAALATVLILYGRRESRRRRKRNGA